jgi:hypothetical protein
MAAVSRSGAAHFEHDNIAALRLSEARQSKIGEWNTRAKGQLVYEKVIPDQQSRKHRSTRDPKWLDEELPNCERDRNRNDEGDNLLDDRSGGSPFRRQLALGVLSLTVGGIMVVSRH